MFTKDVINTCDDGFARQIDTITVNNTYWQSPVRTIAPSSSCTLTVKLDATLPSQANQPICQVRLVSFLFSPSCCLNQTSRVLTQLNSVGWILFCLQSRNPMPNRFAMATISKYPEPPIQSLLFADLTTDNIVTISFYCVTRIYL